MFEILCVSGTIGAIKRKVVVFVLYIPPSMLTAKVSELSELLASEIASARVAFGDPIFFICGDINGKGIGDAFDIDDSLSLIWTDPTRGDAVLDMVYSNVGEFVGEVEVLPPLETEGGIPSDHGCVKIGVEIPQIRNFTWINKVTRKRTGSADARFTEQMGTVDWGGKMEGLGVDEMVEVFENTVEEITNANFPLISTRRRSNEDPWITLGVRRRVKRKKRLYRQSGRTRRWRAADEALQEEVRVKKEEFVEKLLTEPESNY